MVKKVGREMRISVLADLLFGLKICDGALEDRWFESKIAQELDRLDPILSHFFELQQGKVPESGYDGHGQTIVDQSDTLQTPTRPANRRGFEVAIICTLPFEADAVEALFNHYWDNNRPPYDKAPGNPNAYSTGAISCHNIVLTYIPAIGKVNRTIVTTNYQTNFPNIKLVVVVGICSIILINPKDNKIILNNIIISKDIIQYSFRREIPAQFIQKDTLPNLFDRHRTEMCALLALMTLKKPQARQKLEVKITSFINVLQGTLELATEYPSTTHNRLFKATYHHITYRMSYKEYSCSGELISHRHLKHDSPLPAIHFSLITSSNTVMKDSGTRDNIARKQGIVGFEMEGAVGVWDVLPCVVIKGVCDYADGHKMKAWQRYAAATAAACMKAFLEHLIPSSLVLVPYPRNESFVGRAAIMQELEQLPLNSITSQRRVSLFGLGGIGKTQIALEYAYRVKGNWPDVSIFWVHAANAQLFYQSYTSIAFECRIPDYDADDPKTDVLLLVKRWLESKDPGSWLMIIDDADYVLNFVGGAVADMFSLGKNTDCYLPECAHGLILVTTRDQEAALKLAKGTQSIEVSKMDNNDSDQLLRAALEASDLKSDELSELSSRLEYLPVALTQAASFIKENSITVSRYLESLDMNSQHLINLLSQGSETSPTDSEMTRAVIERWIRSFEHIRFQNAFAGELLSLMSFFDQQAIPIEFLVSYDEQQEESRGEMQLAEALDLLKACSGITEGRGYNLNVHPLVQLVTRKWLDRCETTGRFAGSALLAVSQAFPYGRYENWARCREYLLHVYAVLEYEGSLPRNEKLCRATLLHRTGAYLYHQGKWRDAERLQLEAIETRRVMLGEEDPDTLASMNNLASTYWDQGRWKEAEELEVRIADAHKATFGADHLETLVNMSNLATTYWGQGQWKEAEELQVQVMEARKVQLGADHLDTLTCMSNLASIYNSQGRRKEAEELAAQVMDARKANLGPDHPDTLNSMSNLAAIWEGQGRLDEAIDLMGQCVQLRQEVLGSNHPCTVSSLSVLHEWEAQYLNETSVLESTDAEPEPAIQDEEPTDAEPAIQDEELTDGAPEPAIRDEESTSNLAT
ncbi:hypothetical protein Dda_4518 [Drechslerella dactyloides]|uniref:Kinesin light chain n=1 Tax=Drechslerella dactyloides TaxID=74499 RepID=A0AAD6IX48_DREDA|nr:hypothetical protein Dda_4518 [Drechslerella dactyloides]